MCTVKIFLKDDCPKCPAAKRLYDDLVRTDGRTFSAAIEKHNVGQMEGLAEAAMYMVMTTPTVILLDGDENVVAEWRQDVPSVDRIGTIVHELDPGRVEHAPLP